MFSRNCLLSYCYFSSGVWWKTNEDVEQLEDSIELNEALLGGIGKAFKTE